MSSQPQNPSRPLESTDEIPQQPRAESLESTTPAKPADAQPIGSTPVSATAKPIGMEPPSQAVSVSVCQPTALPQVTVAAPLPQGETMPQQLTATRRALPLPKRED